MHALRVDADNDNPPTNERGRIGTAHDLADAFDWKRVGTTVIVEQNLIPAAVEPDVGTARVV